MSTDANTSAALSTTWPGLQQAQQLIHDARVGMLALQSLVSTPAAASATGSPPASAAIVALGVELVAYLAAIGESMEHDVEMLERTVRNYQATEADAVTAIAAIVVGLTGGSVTGTTSTSPTTTAPTTTTTTTATRPRVVTTTGAVR